MDSGSLPISLDDRYRATEGRVFLSATQALVRLALDRRRLDLAAGHDTAGYISGYRGSPLGGYDRALWDAQAILADHHVRFQPGVNEELAATALWGTQQVPLLGDARYQGVFGLWYGKGPGVDRSGDAFKHANLAGTSPLGGIVVLAGDDHGAKSSTSAHQSDQALAAAMIPTLYPADVQDILDFGQAAFAMSRASGCWTALKLITEVADSSATCIVDLARHGYRSDGAPDVHIRLPDDKLAAEARLLDVKLPLAQAFARDHGLDRTFLEPSQPRLGIVTAGKAFHDVMQALGMLGLDRAKAETLGLTVYKVGMTWPLDPVGVAAFARGLETILVVEEKRAVIEPQCKEALFDRLGAAAPAVWGKTTPEGKPVLPRGGELTVTLVARAMRSWLGGRLEGTAADQRLAALGARDEAAKKGAATQVRTEYFCAGCPHSRSTRAPEGSLAIAGIGCHTLASRLPARHTIAPVQMGGEGASWIGQAPFTTRPHAFQNIGDGTYYHSGFLGIRAAIAAGTNITFKLLYNDAVAMTGGQPVEGSLTVGQIARELQAEGARRIVVVTDAPDKYARRNSLPESVEVLPRNSFEDIQDQLAATPGVTVLIYDQVCAAEKRRRRKRGRLAQPDRRLFINERACEGCGDCSAKSSCIAVRPVDTPFGQKRRIDQSVCNLDYSCADGFCPSFVEVEGAEPRRGAGLAPPPDLLAALSEPRPSDRAGTIGVLLTGVGGTGVVTLSAILGMAGHFEGQAVKVLDLTGVAQKNGAVSCHLQFAGQDADLHAARLTSGGVDLALACDAVVAGAAEMTALFDPTRTTAVVNADITPTAATTFATDRAHKGPETQAIARIRAAAGARHVHEIRAEALSVALCGDSLFGNILMLGYACQLGALPLSRGALEAAIRLNGASVDRNLQAFAWGRTMAIAPDRVLELAGLTQPPSQAEPLDTLVERLAGDLVDYANQAYALRYRRLVDRVRAAEQSAGGAGALTEAAARSFHKLLAYKDEYEVARLYSSAEFQASLRKQFGTPKRVRLQLAPPVFARRDPRTGHLRKRRYGPWIFTAMRGLARLKFLRDTAFDPFGRTAERRTERHLIADYEATVERLIPLLGGDTLTDAAELLAVPQTIRGYGHVKDAAVARAKQVEASLWRRIERPE